MADADERPLAHRKTKSPAVDSDVHLVQVPAARANKEDRQPRAIRQAVVLARVWADV